ncbi:MAG: anthranilate synthase component I family protein [Saprospiraceae bacterium]
MNYKTFRIAARYDAELVARITAWAGAHPYAFALDSAGFAGAEYDLIAGVARSPLLQSKAGQAFEALRRAYNRHSGYWLFGFLAYDLKNELEDLHSAQHDGIDLPDLGFICADTVVRMRRSEIEIFSAYADPEDLWNEIMAAAPPTPAPTSPPLVLRPRLSKSEYLEALRRIREHIVEGDVYELNFCMEFFAEEVSIDPVETFCTLKRGPFGAFVRWGDRYALCASPERFLKKNGQKLVSQPIKGTRPRGPDPKADEAIRAELAANEKDRAENVMIVDLVRNDLARNCLPGSVRTEELFGIYTFPRVHQMISTVSGIIRPDAHPIEALRDAFPMGSMTGAPKIRAMQLIEQYEKSRRGLFSGAIGYISPEGDFDFNVVIRSLLYNATNAYLSLHAGGAIVYDSDPHQEYEEALLKARSALPGDPARFVLCV